MENKGGCVGRSEDTLTLSRDTGRSQFQQLYNITNKLNEKLGWEPKHKFDNNYKSKRSGSDAQAKLINSSKT